MRVRTVVSATVLLACAGAGFAQQPAPAGPPARGGYLAGQDVAQAAAILPPAPTPGTQRYANDRFVFAETRKLEGTPRWKLAQEDNVYTAPHLLEVFSCGVGAKLTPQNAPVTLRILTNMLTDQNKFSATAKDVFKRQRPYRIDEGNICIPKTDALAASPDYPSGHTTLSWSAGLILAEIAPDRAESMLMRARAYGESRVVCGVHNASAIEGGRTTGAVAVSVMHSSPVFLAEMQAAKAEIAAVRANPANAVDAAACAVERSLIEKTPYPQ